LPDDGASKTKSPTRPARIFCNTVKKNEKMKKNEKNIDDLRDRVYFDVCDYVKPTCLNPIQQKQKGPQSRICPC
jgi:hypothetical protein